MQVCEQELDLQGGPHTALLAAQRDESAATGILVCAQEALENVHRAAFDAMQQTALCSPSSGPEPVWDAPAVMARKRSSVLDSVTLLFSKCTLSMKVCLTCFVPCMMRCHIIVE